MERRDFLVRGGLMLGAAALSTGSARAAAAPARAVAGAAQDAPQDWAWVRSQFDLLDPRVAHFDGFFLTSHPKSVRAAIEKHRAGLDKNPSAYLHEKSTRPSARSAPPRANTWASTDRKRSR